jgi:hypothetical protein
MADPLSNRPSKKKTMHVAISEKQHIIGVDGVDDAEAYNDYKEMPLVDVQSRGGPKPTSECCVSLIWMVMQGEYTGIYPGSGKRRPYVQ